MYNNVNIKITNITNCSPYIPHKITYINFGDVRCQLNSIYRVIGLRYY